LTHPTVVLHCGVREHQHSLEVGADGTCVHNYWVGLPTPAPIEQPVATGHLLRGYGVMLCALGWGVRRDESRCIDKNGQGRQGTGQGTATEKAPWRALAPGEERGPDAGARCRRQGTGQGTGAVRLYSH
jgi:hypothetical protein